MIIVNTMVYLKIVNKVNSKISHHKEKNPLFFFVFVSDNGN